MSGDDSDVGPTPLAIFDPAALRQRRETAPPDARGFDSSFELAGPARRPLGGLKPNLESCARLRSPACPDGIRGEAGLPEG